VLWDQKKIGVSGCATAEVGFGVVRCTVKAASDLHNCCLARRPFEKPKQASP
jgi:hypothetical protein